MWKKKSSKLIFDHKRLSVREDIAEMEDGTETDYVYIDHKFDAAGLIVINSEGKILMLKEYAYLFDETLWTFPGGLIPTDEKIIDGAKRELKEETGIVASKITELGVIYPYFRKNKEKLYIFTAEELDFQKQELDHEEEGTQMFWLTEKEIDEMIVKREIKIDHILATWMLYKSKS